MSTEARQKREQRSVLMDNLEVCAMLGVRPDTWRKRVQSGSAPLPHSRQGNRTYYRRADVRAFIKTGHWPAAMDFRGRDRLEVPADDPDSGQTLP